MIWHWLLYGRRPAEDYISGWSNVRAERAWRDTERILLGCVVAGSKRVVGSRAHDAIMADRAKRVAQLEWRQAQRKRA
jgi:hypothetical protein